MMLLSSISIFIVVVLVIIIATIILAIKAIYPYYEDTKYGIWISRSIVISIYLLLMISVLPRLFNYLFILN